MIETKKLKKIFQTDEVETTALNDISLKVEKGEFVAIMGPFGCGWDHHYYGDSLIRRRILCEQDY
jgi:ABC-type dipeptide/oligopeptide/nickel transport system ATPase subunit